MTWIDTVHTMANNIGIPTRIIDSVIGVESGFNPSATGDNGTSFGIFQLHTGGQLGSLSPSQAYDPVTNAYTALPYIARGIKSAGAFTDTLTWWENFGSASGHPGGTPANAANEAQLLKTAYDTGNYKSADGSYAGSTTSSSTNTTTGATAATGASGTSLTTTLAGAGTTVLLLIVGITILIVAVVLLSK